MNKRDQPTANPFTNIVCNRLAWCTLGLYRTDGAVATDRKRDSNFSSCCLAFKAFASKSIFGRPHTAPTGQ